MDKLITAALIFILGITAITLFILGWRIITNSPKWQAMRRREQGWINRVKREQECAEIFKQERDSDEN